MRLTPSSLFRPAYRRAFGSGDDSEQAAVDKDSQKLEEKVTLRSVKNDTASLSAKVSDDLPETSNSMMNPALKKASKPG